MMNTTLRSLLTVSSFALSAITASGCATETADATDEMAVDNAALTAATRTKVLDGVREQLTGTGRGITGELRGAAFLRRGDKLVFKVRKMVERGDYVVFYGDAMGRKTDRRGRITDYELKTADYAGSDFATYIAEGFVDGTHVEALMRKQNGRYVPAYTIPVGTESPTPLFQFASTDTIILELECRASQVGFTATDLGRTPGTQLCQ